MAETFVIIQVVKEIINLAFTCRQLPDSAVNELIIHVNGEIDWIMGCHEVLVRPDLFYGEAPADLVADLDMGCFVCLHRAADRRALRQRRIHVHACIAVGITGM